MNRAIFGIPEMSDIAGSQGRGNHDVRQALLTAADRVEDCGTSDGTSQREPDARREGSQQGYEHADADGEDGQHEDENLEDDADGGQLTDGGHGAISEPEAGDGSSQLTGYYSADGTMHGHRAGNRSPRVRAAQRGAALSFGRASVPAPRGGSTRRRTTASQPARERRDGRAAAEDEGSADDTRVWRGNEPLIPQSSSFALPPLRVDMPSGIPSGGLDHHPVNLLRCTSYCCSLGIDLVALNRHLAEGRRLACRMHKDGLNAVLHCVEQHRASEAFSHEGRSEGRSAHSFYFSYGCVVTWGLSEREERERLLMLAQHGFMIEPLSEEEVDDFGYTHLEGAKASIAKDVITLTSYQILEKLAISFGLAQSVKLGVFERTVEQTIQETRSIPERMARDGKIRLRRAAITKRIGQLFVDRASINLHSDILDHPEFFWENDEWLSLYVRASKYLEIDRRTEVLNKRLDIIKELFDMLASEMNQNHSNKLEWIIIILILIEVFFQVFQLVLDHFY